MNLRLLGSIGILLSLGCGGFGAPTPHDTGVVEVQTVTAPKTVASPAKKKVVVEVPAAPKKVTTGEIEVVTAAAVSVSIDGSSILFDPIRGSYRKKKLSPGIHTMEVFNALGREVAEEKVDVPEGQRVKYRYKSGGHLESFGTMPLDD